MQAEADEPTFARDVAPIVHARCASCHRPGSSGPFPLLTYDDVVSHARQIAAVTRKRIMPPWLPAPDVVEFADERRLRDDEIATIARWVEAGTPPGDPAAIPAPPQFPDGWQLGTPDLVVSMPEPYVVPAEARDLHRNFVLPVPLASPRWVRAIEIRFDNLAPVHHATLQADESGGCREWDGRDAEQGFGGMSLGPSRAPGDHFVGWTPGKQPQPFHEGTAWRAVPGTDLVLQLHLVPTGREERVRASIGLYFTDAAPSVPIYSLSMRTDTIDIPPGERAYVVEETFTLPVAARAISIYPHAHYLGHTMAITATAPDGAVTPLLRIDDWNFDWQDSYRYARPVPIAAGSTIRMHYTYDNSEQNPRNPNHPPIRVQLGNQSSDEMGAFTLELVFDSVRDRLATMEAFERRSVARHPGDFPAWYNLGVVLAELGRADEAMEAYRKTLEIEPRHVLASNNLGNLLKKQRRYAEAIALFEEAARIHPESALTLNNLGAALLESGELERGLERVRAAIALQPELLEAQLNLALANELLQRPDAAALAYAEAHRIDPSSFFALDGLTRSAARRGEFEKAEELARRGAELAPGSVEAQARLAAILSQRGRFDESAAAWEKVVLLAPGDGTARRDLGRALERAGKLAAAMGAYQEALRLAPNDFLALVGLSRALVNHPDPTQRSPALAVRYAEEAAKQETVDALQLADALATAYAAAGRLDDSLAQLERRGSMIDGRPGPRFDAMRAQLDERRRRLREAMERGGR